MADANTQSTGLARRGETGLTRPSPWNEFAEMRRQMDDLFSRAFGYTPLSRLIPGETGDWEPEVDIYETNDKVIFYASLPGFAPNEINVESTGDTVMISGERGPHPEHEKARHYRHGWTAGFHKFSASYSLPCEIAPNKVKATFRNGVLQLELPKTEQAKNKAIKVNVQSG
jgi:HSP20 family protein